jgi:hypothetical protein
MNACSKRKLILEGAVGQGQAAVVEAVAVGPAVPEDRAAATPRARDATRRARTLASLPRSKGLRRINFSNSRRVGPSRRLESFLSRETAALSVDLSGATREARTPAPLDTLQDARSWFEPSMWRGDAWARTGRPGVRACGAWRGGWDHRQFLAADRRGPRQDDQIVKTKPPAGSCSRMLDQSLGRARARCSRNRPLEPLCSIARLAQGCAGHPCHRRRMPLTSTGTPAPDVDALCLVTCLVNRRMSIYLASLAPLRRHAARGSPAP